MARSVNTEAEFENIFITTSKLKKKLESQIEAEVRWRGYADFKSSFLPILILLYKGGKTSISISESVGVTKQAVSKVVAEMTEMGYLKSQINKTDRRSNIILLSAKGKRMAIETRKCYNKLIENYKNLLGRNKYDQMMDALDSLLVFHD